VTNVQPAARRIWEHIETIVFWPRIVVPHDVRVCFLPYCAPFQINLPEINVIVVYHFFTTVLLFLIKSYQVNRPREIRSRAAIHAIGDM